MNRINLICLGVKDMIKSLEFYKNIGFKTYGKETSTVVFFDNNGTKLELYPLEALAKDIDEINPPSINMEGFNGITLAINMKSEEEVDDFMKIIENHGGRVIKKAQRVFWGGYSGYFTDPNGYYWEVAYSKDWKFDKNEMLIIEK